MECKEARNKYIDIIKAIGIISIVILFYLKNKIFICAIMIIYGCLGILCL